EGDWTPVAPLVVRTQEQDVILAAAELPDQVHRPVHDPVHFRKEHLSDDGNTHLRTSEQGYPSWFGNGTYSFCASAITMLGWSWIGKKGLFATPRTRGGALWSPASSRNGVSQPP